jgi:hypothetical protein
MLLSKSVFLMSWRVDFHVRRIYTNATWPNHPFPSPTVWMRGSLRQQQGPTQSDSSQISAQIMPTKSQHKTSHSVLVPFGFLLGGKSEPDPCRALEQVLTAIWTGSKFCRMSRGTHQIGCPPISIEPLQVLGRIRPTSSSSNCAAERYVLIHAQCALDRGAPLI